MRNHDAPAVFARQVGRLDRLGHRADLIDLHKPNIEQRASCYVQNARANLEQQTVARFLFNRLLNAFRIGDGQIVADKLNVGRGHKV